jgi:hypothetical protein
MVGHRNWVAGDCRGDHDALVHMEGLRSPRRSDRLGDRLMIHIDGVSITLFAKPAKWRWWR